MDIPFPWNVMTGMTCASLITWFLVWIHHENKKTRRRYREWARQHGWSVEKTDRAYMGRRVVHLITGDHHGHPARVSEEHIECPVPRADVYISVSGIAMLPDQTRPGTTIQIEDDGVTLVRRNQVLELETMVKDLDFLASLIDSSDDSVIVR